MSQSTLLMICMEISLTWYFNDFHIVLLDRWLGKLVVACRRSAVYSTEP